MTLKIASSRWELNINRERSTVSALCQGLQMILGWEPAGEAGPSWVAGWSRKMHKYVWNTNTNTRIKTRKTQIQKYQHTQIRISPLALLAKSVQCSGGEKLNYSEKVLSRKRPKLFVPEIFQKLPIIYDLVSSPTFPKSYSCSRQKKKLASVSSKFRESTEIVAPSFERNSSLVLSKRRDASGY